MRGVFDIIGPVMIGPSSSHTAGAVRLGKIAGKILGERAVAARIWLHGSFAKTYRGHGTDRALLAGILGFATDDARIREALEIAAARGVAYAFEATDLGESAHPNTARITLTGESGRCTTVEGASVGGGNILVSRIDGFDVEMTGRYYTLATVHEDRPGVIMGVTQVLARQAINVAFMRVSRKTRGAQALMILEVDDAISDAVAKEVVGVCGVTNSFCIPPV